MSGQRSAGAPFGSAAPAYPPYPPLRRELALVALLVLGCGVVGGVVVGLVPWLCGAYG